MSIKPYMFAIRSGISMLYMVIITSVISAVLRIQPDVLLGPVCIVFAVYALIRGRKGHVSELTVPRYPCQRASQVNYQSLQETNKQVISHEVKKRSILKEIFISRTRGELLFYGSIGVACMLYVYLPYFL